jgi:hypothetical protein
LSGDNSLKLCTGKQRTSEHHGSDELGSQRSEGKDAEIAMKVLDMVLGVWQEQLVKGEA